MTDPSPGADKPPKPGFEPHFRRSPVTDPWEPLFSKVGDEAIRLGLWIGDNHCNARQALHGGVLASLCDNAMGLSYAKQAGPGVVTLSLNLDYLGAGRLGQWLEVRPAVLRAGKGVGFVEAHVFADEHLIARASATFRNVSAPKPDS